MTGTVIIESTRRKSEKHFPGSLSEFSNIQYAYDTFPESAARELSGDVRHDCRSAQTDGTVQGTVIIEHVSVVLTAQ